ncbi:MAG: hypothetical protein H6836_09965 [Planctomycetes bacterium]|nr:hypothetical protein [Planctomycetota bacterium]
MTMALHYRPLVHQPVSGLRRLLELARQEAGVLFRTRWGVALFALCQLPLLVQLVRLMIMFGVIQFGPASMRDRLQGPMPRQFAELDPNRVIFYLEPLADVMPGMVFFLLMTSVVVARSVARDRATNALELYWTRGITPAGYVLAKWWGGCMLTGTITVLGPLLTWVTAVLLADDWQLLFDTAGPLALGLLAFAGVTMLMTGVGTLVSAIASTANQAVVLWSVLLVGSQALAAILALVLKARWIKSSVSLWEAGGVLVRAAADMPQEDYSVPGAGATLAIVFTVALLLARRRLRVTEALQ